MSVLPVHAMRFLQSCNQINTAKRLSPYWYWYQSGIQTDTFVHHRPVVHDLPTQAVPIHFGNTAGTVTKPSLVTGEEGPERLLNPEKYFDLSQIELTDKAGNRIWLVDKGPVNPAKQIAYAMCDQAEAIIKVMEHNSGSALYNTPEQQAAWEAKAVDDLDTFFPDTYWDSKEALNFLNRWVIAPTERGVDVVRLHLLPTKRDIYWKQVNHIFSHINVPMGEQIYQLPGRAFKAA